MSAADLVPLTSRPPSRSHPSRFRIWLQAIRYFSFTASAIPILVGSMLAMVDREFSLFLFVVMLAAAIACHAGANLANDYFDHIKGIDTAESLGPSKVIQQELLSPGEVKRGMIVAFAIATILGLVIVVEAGWPILVLALVSLGAAILYTGGPKPLGYIALGEVTVFVFMGPVMVGGAYYVMAGKLIWTAILASIPIGLLVAAILHANNIRDIEFDRKAGKVTLATLLGRHRANIEYLVLVAGTYLITVVWVISEPQFWPVLITALTLPLAFWLINLVRGANDVKTLNVALRRTAGLHLRFGTLMTIGLIVRVVLDRV